MVATLGCPLLMVAGAGGTRSLVAHLGREVAVFLNHNVAISILLQQVEGDDLLGWRRSRARALHPRSFRKGLHRREYAGGRPTGTVWAPICPR